MILFEYIVVNKMCDKNKVDNSAKKFVLLSQNYLFSCRFVHFFFLRIEFGKNYSPMSFHFCTFACLLCVISQMFHFSTMFYIYLLNLVTIFFVQKNVFFECTFCVVEVYFFFAMFNIFLNIYFFLSRIAKNIVMHSQK